MLDNREQVIKTLIGKGYSASQINKGFIDLGEKPLTRFEQADINTGRYGQSYLQKAGNELSEFGQGLSSLGGAAKLYVTNPSFRKGINTAVGQYAKDVKAGTKNPVDDLANLVIRNYGVDVDTIRRNPLEAAKTAIAYANANPVSTGLDVAAFIPAGKTAELVSRIPGVGDSQIRKMLMATPREKQINSILNIPSPDVTRLRNELNQQVSRVGGEDLEQAIRDLRLGTKIAPESTRSKVIDVYNKFQPRLEALGVDANKARENAVATYVQLKLNPELETKVPNIKFQYDDVVNAIKNPIEENLNKLSTNKDTLNKLVQEGNKLFDEGSIIPISQREMNFNLGKVPVDVGGGITADKYIGTASSNRIAYKFSDAYRKLADDIADAQASMESIDEIASKFGRNVSLDEAKKISANELVVSPTEFKKGVRTSFGQGKYNAQSEILSSTKGLSKSKLKDYANDLYVINKKDIQAFQNRYAPSIDSGVIGKTLRALEPAINAFKSSVLTKPVYFAGNRIGNWSLGLIGGADYAEVARRMAKSKLSDYIPDYLLSSTSYHGFAPSYLGDSMLDTFKTFGQDVSRPWKEVGQATTIPEKIGKGVEASLVSQQEMFKPLFRTEATAEVIDRAAVYFKEAKNYAKETGKDLEEVLKLGKNDTDVQRTLIERVNNTLGDYVGRNHFINPTLYKAGKTAFPFHKVVTTSKDVLAHSVTNHPIRTQLFLRDPARIGYDLQQRDISYDNQPDDRDVRGGITVIPSYNKRFPARKVYNDYNPILTIPQTIVPWLTKDREGRSGLDAFASTVAGNMTPITGLFNALQGKDSFGNNAVGPNTYNVSGRTVTLDDNGNVIEQRGSSTIGALAGYIGKNFMPLATFMNNSAGPIAGALSGEGFYKPTNRAIFGQLGRDSMTIPYIVEGQTDRPGIRTLDDAISPQLGFRTRDVYYPQQDMLTPNMMRRVFRQKTIRGINQGRFE